MLRNDPNAVVRQNALVVWKSVVEHTPATLKSMREPVFPLTASFSFLDAVFGEINLSLTRSFAWQTFCPR